MRQPLACREFAFTSAAAAEAFHLARFIERVPSPSRTPTARSALGARAGIPTDAVEGLQRVEPCRLIIAMGMTAFGAQRKLGKGFGGFRSDA